MVDKHDFHTIVIGPEYYSKKITDDNFLTITSGPVYKAHIYHEYKSKYPVFTVELPADPKDIVYSPNNRYISFFSKNLFTVIDNMTGEFIYHMMSNPFKDINKLLYLNETRFAIYDDRVTIYDILKQSVVKRVEYDCNINNEILMIKYVPGGILIVSTDKICIVQDKSIFYDAGEIFHCLYYEPMKYLILLLRDTIGIFDIVLFKMVKHYRYPFYVCIYRNHLLFSLTSGKINLDKLNDEILNLDKADIRFIKKNTVKINHHDNFDRYTCDDKNEYVCFAKSDDKNEYVCFAKSYDSPINLNMGGIKIDLSDSSCAQITKYKFQPLHEDYIKFIKQLAGYRIIFKGLPQIYPTIINEHMLFHIFRFLMSENYVKLIFEYFKGSIDIPILLDKLIMWK